MTISIHQDESERTSDEALSDVHIAHVQLIQDAAFGESAVAAVTVVRTFIWGLWCDGRF